MAPEARYFSDRVADLGVTGELMTPELQRRMARGSLVPYPISSQLVDGAFARPQSFDEDLSTAEDLQFFADIAARGAVATVPDVLIGYRVHVGAKSHRDFEEQMLQTAFIRRRAAARAEGRELHIEGSGRVTSRAGPNVGTCAGSICSAALA